MFVYFLTSRSSRNYQKSMIGVSVNWLAVSVWKFNNIIQNVFINHNTQVVFVSRVQHTLHFATYKLKQDSNWIAQPWNTRRIVVGDRAQPESLSTLSPWKGPFQSVFATDLRGPDKYSTKCGLACPSSTPNEHVLQKGDFKSGDLFPPPRNITVHTEWREKYQNHSCSLMLMMSLYNHQRFSALMINANLWWMVRKAMPLLRNFAKNVCAQRVIYFNSAHKDVETGESFRSAEKSEWASFHRICLIGKNMDLDQVRGQEFKYSDVFKDIIVVTEIHGCQQRAPSTDRLKTFLERRSVRMHQLCIEWF